MEKDFANVCSLFKDIGYLKPSSNHLGAIYADSFNVTEML